MFEIIDIQPAEQLDDIESHIASGVGGEFRVRLGQRVKALPHWRLAQPRGQTDLEFLLEKILNRSDPKESWTPRSLESV